MKIAFIYFAKNKNKFIKFVDAFCEGLKTQNHDIDLIDGTDTGKKLTGYKYIIIGAEALPSLKGSIPDSAGRFIPAAGMLEGKNAVAFVTSTFIGTTKALLRLMRIMEKEGLLIIANEILDKQGKAFEIGKTICIE